VNYFETKKINRDKIITIVNVWSYKVRAIICSFSSDWIKIVWYWEKRQSRLDVVNNEINNIHGVSDTIKDAILKAELDNWYSSEEIIINPFFCNTFFYSKNIFHKQKNNSESINHQRLYEIISKVQKIWLNSIRSEMDKNYWLNKDELHLILWNILDISIDWKKEKTLFNKKGEDVNIKILNSFILESDFEIINDIWNYIWKKIIKIIPEEYSVTKIWNENKDIVILNIWNSIVNLSFKTKEWFLLNSIKLNIWIWDLIKDIKKTSNKSRWEIIKKLDRDDLFKDEKREFLSHFTDILTTGLKEILNWNICPESFILIWWWANNSFIKEYISSVDFWSYWLKTIKNIDFLEVSIDNLKKIEWVESILNISNVDLISQVLSTEFILKSENDEMEQVLNKVIKEIY